jgi:hypothetical protein
MAESTEQISHGGTENTETIGFTVSFVPPYPRTSV